MVTLLSKQVFGNHDPESRQGLLVSEDRRFGHLGPLGGWGGSWRVAPWPPYLDDRHQQEGRAGQKQEIHRLELATPIQLGTPFLMTPEITMLICKGTSFSSPLAHKRRIDVQIGNKQEFLMVLQVIQQGEELVMVAVQLHLDRHLQRSPASRAGRTLALVIWTPCSLARFFRISWRSAEPPPGWTR